MVEGPGCKVKGEKLKPRIKGQTVVNADGEKKPTSSKAAADSTKDVETHTGRRESSGFVQLVGHSIEDIQTLGKELFIFFHDTQKCLRNAPASCAKIREFQNLDICFERFSHKRALELMRTQVGRLVSDVLLDQLLLPGVGNIIKNEVRPIKVECRKNNKPLGPHLKIYNKEVCGQCKQKVVTTRVGETNARVTSYCPRCQTNNLKNALKRTLPSKNSLLGWVTSEAATSTSVLPEDWTCTVCTLINKACRTCCLACDSQHRAIDTASTTFDNDLLRGQPHTTVLRPKRQATEAPGFEVPAKKHFKMMDSSKSPEIKSLQAPQTNNIDKEYRGSESGKVQGPECQKHNKKCLMRRVHKEGGNHNRMFWACHVRGCNFFQWADGAFPVCEGHGKVTVLRTVLKEGANNGRKFFACPLDKKKQCRFFKWAENY